MNTYKDFEDVVNRGMTFPENKSNFYRLLDLLTTQGNRIETIVREGNILNYNNIYSLNKEYLGEEYRTIDKGYDYDYFIKYVKTKAIIILKHINNNTIQVSDELKEFIEFIESCTLEEYIDFINKNDDYFKGKKELPKALKEYSKLFTDYNDLREFLCIGYDWHYLRSYLLDRNNPNNFFTKDVNHRLYITMDYKFLSTFIYEFIDILDNKNIPYLLKSLSPKSNGIMNRTDNLVIYADTEERVTEYVNILLGLIHENKMYEYVTYRPAPHLGNIENLIGYGFEPKNKDGKIRSYSSLLEPLIQDSFDLAKIEYDIYVERYEGDKSSYFINRNKWLNESLHKIRESNHSKSMINIFTKVFFDKFYEELNKKDIKVDRSFCLGLDQKEKTY